MADKRQVKLMLQTVTHAETKNGKKYMRLQLLEEGGRLWPGMCWEDKEIEAGTIVDALTEESEYNGQAQLTVLYMRVLPLAEQQPEKFLPKTPYSIEGLYIELKDFINSITNEALRDILHEYVVDPRLQRAPAAQKLHHAYIGGLLEHTVCLLRLAKVVTDLYPKELNRDELYAIAILHDLGKMDEISSGLNMEYTTLGELIGHVGIGLLRINRLMDKHSYTQQGKNAPTAFGTLSEPTDLRLKILHGVASHHGNLNYGALKTPMTVEAQVFSDLDGLDAHIAKLRACIERTPADKEWSDKSKWDEPKAYLGRKTT
jgi:3'-5' exoribonuclease